MTKKYTRRVKKFSNKTKRRNKKLTKRRHKKLTKRRNKKLKRKKNRTQKGGSDMNFDENANIEKIIDQEIADAYAAARKAAEEEWAQYELEMMKKEAEEDAARQIINQANIRAAIKSDLEYYFLKKKDAAREAAREEWWKQQAAEEAAENAAYDAYLIAIENAKNTQFEGLPSKIMNGAYQLSDALEVGGMKIPLMMKK